MNDDVVFDGKIAELNRISSKGLGQLGLKIARAVIGGY